MNKELEIISTVYHGLVSSSASDGIPVDLRPAQVVGTVQDDPFDCWVELQLKRVLPDGFEVFHAGKLTTPDLIILDRETNTIVGLEIKKLIQRHDGNDPRGLTMDYNSCLPCGHAMVKVGRDTVIVPCYYVFALLNPDSSRIITLIVMDGDFLNYDFDLHREAKYSNFTEYHHGPYGEGSVRHRKMYTYPNPLNSGLKCFAFRQLMVLKKSFVDNTEFSRHVNGEIIRTDKFGNTFFYSLVDELRPALQDKSEVVSFIDIFHACKARKPKERVAYIPEIPAL